MGIPSYFRYIIEHNDNVVREWREDNNNVIDNLYFDGNSIIYDTFCENEEEHLQKIAERICYIIYVVQPQKKVMITFDGVPPLAKIKQQRTRRIKSSYLKHIEHSILNSPEEKSSRLKITTGTEFMNKLDEYLEHYFHNKNVWMNKYLYKMDEKPEIILSGSREYGEGEHKIFNYIRNYKHYHKKTSTVIYGLDADLIVLGLCHHTYCMNMILLREPKHISSTQYKSEFIQLDIQQFVRSIYSLYTERIYDYAFITFLLGNDFLPHHPSINLREDGLDELLKHLTKYPLIDDDTLNINWSHLKLYFKELMIYEERRIRKQYDLNKLYGEKYINLKKPLTKEQKMKMFERIPVIHREHEEFICPGVKGWEYRYYQVLHKQPLMTTSFIKKSVHHYLTGLQWVWTYYTKGHNMKYINSWCYDYDYPPLIKHIYEYFNDNIYVPTTSLKILPIHQLCYVIPPEYREQLIPKKYMNIFPSYEQFSIHDLEFEWSFCRYLWESHPQLELFPEIFLDIQTIIEKISKI